MSDASRLEEIRGLIKDGQVEQSLVLLKTYWLEHPDDSEAADLLSTVMKEAGRSELSERLSALAKQLPAEPEKDETPSPSPSLPVAPNQPAANQPAPNKKVGPQELFEAGFSLIDARQHELAAMLLNQCVKLVPDEPVVNYELGFALMSLKRFEEAIAYFENASIMGTADFDTYLNLSACYTMTRRLDDAINALEKIDKLEMDDEQTRELQHRKMVLRRLSMLSSKTHLSPRDWMFVLYGSILLRNQVPKEHSKEDAVSIGSTLAILKGVLEGLRLESEVVEFFGPQSRPLASALSELLEISVGSYKGSSREEKALLTMSWANDVVGPHESFLENTHRRALFAYGLSIDEPLPLVPEIVGTLGYDDVMPWDESGRKITVDSEANVLAPSEIEATLVQQTKAILYNARDLESEPHIIHAVQEALDFYIGKEGLLVLANSKTFPRRCEYTAEVLF
jgi:tetratricopeptide (TPR) repeat protein